MKRFIMITALLFAGALQAATGLTGSTLGNRLTGTTVSISEVTAAGAKKLLFTETTSTGDSMADCAFDAHIDGLEDGKLYLYEANGGADYDLDGDGVADAVPTENRGTLHLLAYGSDIKAAGQVNMTFVSDELYTKFRCTLAETPYALDGAQMNAAAARIIRQDIDGDTAVTLKDVLAFDPVANQDALSQLYQSKQIWIVSAIHNDDRFYFDGGVVEMDTSYMFDDNDYYLLPAAGNRLFASKQGVMLLDTNDTTNISMRSKTSAYANETFDMALSPAEDYLYLAAGADGVQVFRVGGDGNLTLENNNSEDINATYGVTVSRDGNHLYAATENTVCHLEVNGSVLNKTGGCIAIGSSTSHRLKISPDGNYLFVYSAISSGDDVSVYALENNGAVLPNRVVTFYDAYEFVFSENGDYLFVSTGDIEEEFRVYDLRTLSGGQSDLVASIPFIGRGGIAYRGGRVYLNGVPSGAYEQPDRIWQIDVSDPENPFVRGVTGSWAVNMAAEGPRIYGVQNERLMIYDISDPDSVSASGLVADAGAVVGYDRNATVAFITRKEGTLLSRIALDPAEPFIGEKAVTVTVDGSGTYFTNPTVSTDGKKVYVIQEGEFSFFTIFGAAVLNSKGSIRIASSGMTFDVSGNDTTAAVLFNTQATLLNISDETNISEKGSVDFNGTYPQDIALSADGRHLFSLNSDIEANSSVWVYDISDANSAVRIGEVSGMPGYAEKVVRSHDGRLLAVVVNNYYGADGIDSNVVLINVTDAASAAIVGTLPAYDADGFINDVSFTSDGALIVRESCWSCTGSPVMPYTVYDLSDPAHAEVLKRIGTPHLEAELSEMALTPSMDRMFAISNGNLIGQNLCDAALPTVQNGLPLNLNDVNLSAENITAVIIVDAQGTELETVENVVDGNSSTTLSTVKAGETIAIVVERSEGGVLSSWYYNFDDGTFYDSRDGSTDFFMPVTAETAQIDVDAATFTAREAYNTPPQLHIGAGGYGPMGIYPVEAGVRAMAQRDTLLYLGDQNGVLALDTADPASPRLLASSGTIENGVNDLLLSNSTLFAAQESGLFIYDVSYPDALPLLGSYFSSDYNLLSLAYDATSSTLCVLGSRYDAAGQYVYLLDVNDSTNPKFRATIELNASNTYRALSLHGHTLYVTSEEANATAYDISDPDTPAKLAGLMPPLKQLEVSADGKRYYGIYTDSGSYNDYFVILDRTLLPLGVFPREDFFGIGTINDFSVDEAKALVYLATGDGGAILDISDPAAITINDRMGLDSSTGTAKSVLVSEDNIVFATDEGINLFDNTRPQLFHVWNTAGLDGNVSDAWIWEQLQRHGDHLYFAGYDRLLQYNEADLTLMGTFEILPQGSVAEMRAYDVSDDEQTVFAVIDEGNGTSTLRRLQNGTQTGSLAFEGMAMEVHPAVNGGIHYVSVEPNEGNWSVKIIDTNASTMRLLSAYESEESFIDMTTDATGTLLYLAGDVVRVLDVSNPYASKVLASLTLTVPGSENNASAISLELDATGRTLYAGTLYGVAVIDVSDPFSPVLTGWKSAAISQLEFFEYAMVARSDDPSRLFTSGKEGPNIFDGTDYYRTGHFNELMRLIPSLSNDKLTFDSIPVFQYSDDARELRQADVTPRLYLKEGFGTFELPVQLFDTIMAVSNIHIDLNASGIVSIGSIAYGGMSTSEWNLTVPLLEGGMPGIVRLTATVTDDDGAAGTMPLDVVVYKAALPQPPQPPQTLEANATAPEKVTLKWQGAEGSVEGYRIYRDGSALSDVGAEDVTYDDLTVEEGTTYRYGVSAYNDAGESNRTEVNVTTPHRMTITIDNVMREDFNITEVAVVDGEGKVIGTIRVDEGDNSFTEAVAGGETFSLRFDVETSAGTVHYWYNFSDGRFYAQKGEDADFERTTSTELTLIAIDATASNWPADAVHFVGTIGDMTTTDVSADFNVSIGVSQSNHRTLFLEASVNYPTMLALTPYWESSGVEAAVYEHSDLQLQLTPKTTGTARVTLRLHDTEGNSATRSFNVTIVPAVNINVSEVKATVPFSVDFEATVEAAFGEVTAVMWDFNDSADTTGLRELNASHTFTASGDYSVKVTVLNADFRRAAATRSILVLDDNVSWQIKAGWNYLSLPTSTHLDEEGLQALFASQSVRYLIKQSGSGWAYWDRNLSANPQMQMNRFSALDSAEGFALYADEDLVIELPVNRDNDPDALRQLYGDGWYLVGVNATMTVEALTALVASKGRQLRLVEYIDPEGTLHVYTPDTALDAQISQRFPRLEQVERTWGFYIQIEEVVR